MYIWRILLQGRRDKHNQRNIEREPSRAPIPVNAEDLVQVGRERGGDETNAKHCEQQILS